MNGRGSRPTIPWNAGTATISNTWTSRGNRHARPAAHSTYLASGDKTCIDCHKGIAHQLPDMKGVPGWDVTFTAPTSD